MTALPWVPFVIALAAAFAAGSIPFAVLIGKAKGVDIRTLGSKNAGATNVGRVLGFRYFLLCFALDAAKGFAPVFAFGATVGWTGLDSLTLPPPATVLWLTLVAAAVMGHMFSPWIAFKGGKGVATGLGAMLGVFPALTIPALGSLLVFLGVLWMWRYVSLASIIAAASAPAWVWYFFNLASRTLVNPPEEPGAAPQTLPVRSATYVIATAVLGALIIYKHRANIARLARHQEPTIGAGRAQSDASTSVTTSK